MKILKVLIVIIYAIVYAYSVWMTSIRPEETIWGWICTLVFLISSIYLITIFTKNKTQNDDKDGKDE